MRRNYNRKKIILNKAPDVKITDEININELDNKGLEKIEKERKKVFADLDAEIKYNQTKEEIEQKELSIEEIAELEFLPEDIAISCINTIIEELPKADILSWENITSENYIEIIEITTKIIDFVKKFVNLSIRKVINFNICIFGADDIADTGIYDIVKTNGIYVTPVLTHIKRIKTRDCIYVRDNDQESLNLFHNKCSIYKSYPDIFYSFDYSAGTALILSTELNPGGYAVIKLVKLDKYFYDNLFILNYFENYKVFRTSFGAFLFLENYQKKIKYSFKQTPETVENNKYINNVKANDLLDLFTEISYITKPEISFDKPMETPKDIFISDTKREENKIDEEVGCIDRYNNRISYTQYNSIKSKIYYKQYIELYKRRIKLRYTKKFNAKDYKNNNIVDINLEEKIKKFMSGYIPSVDEWRNIYKIF